MSATADVTKQKITKEFDVKLDHKEIEAKAHEMSALLSEVETLEQEKKETVAKFSTDIDERYKKLAEIGKAVRAGQETRTLEAEMVKDFNAATKKFFFEGKLILEEAMTPDELQLEFGDEPKPNSPEDLGFKKPKKKPAKTARDGRLEDAQKAIASKKKGKGVAAEVIALETGKKTKRSPLGGVYK